MLLAKHLGLPYLTQCLVRKDAGVNLHRLIVLHFRTRDKGIETKYKYWIQDVLDQKAVVSQYCRYTAQIKIG